MKDSFKRIISIFELEIAAQYERHENKFDAESYHGRFHILRTLFLANTIMEYYIKKGIEVDTQKAFYALLFHDIAREGNGVDLWEKESALVCHDYLISKNYGSSYAFGCSDLIYQISDRSIERQILKDADVLDYHRFFISDDDQDYFDRSHLVFGGEKEVFGSIDLKAQEGVIKLARNLVQFTSEILVETPTYELVAGVNKYYRTVNPW